MLLNREPSNPSPTALPPPPTGSALPAAQGAGEQQPSLLRLPYTSWGEGQHEALERRIADYLGSFQGVQAADVLIGRPAETPFAAEQKPVTAVVRLSLAPGARLSPEQILSLARSVATRVADLDLKQVTITDAAARGVFEGGVARPEGAVGPPLLAAPLPPAQPQAFPSFGRAEVALVGGLGLLVGLLVGALAWGMRRGPARPAAAGDEEPVAFLAELSASEVVALLADERPFLLAAVLPTLPPKTQRRVLRLLGSEQHEALAGALASTGEPAAGAGAGRSREALRAAGAALQANLGQRRQQADAVRALLAAAPASERESPPASR